MKQRVVICDDEERYAQAWKTELESVPEVSAKYEILILSVSEFRNAVKELDDRQLAARRPPRSKVQKDGVVELGGPRGDQANSIDSADILVVDFDLIRLQAGDDLAPATATETGERIAYLARCYSRCGYIVALNQYQRRPTFDLRLTGHLQSYADLNIHSDHLANPGLWMDKRDGFRPWSWPCLSRAVEQQDERTSIIAGAIDAVALEAIGGLNAEDVSPLFAREQLEFLSPKTRPLMTTFASFVLESGGGLRGKDRLWEPSALPRIAAARLHKWLERSLLSGQEILVDAPHLALRYPSLLSDDTRKIGTWDATASVCVADLDRALQTNALSEAQLGNASWTSRPAWVWPRVQQNRRIREVADPWAPRDSPFVFCEDVSTFRRPDHARSFTAEVDSPWVQRYVCRPIRGTGAKRKPYSGQFGLAGIRYEPGVRFAI